MKTSLLNKILTGALAVMAMTIVLNLSQARAEVITADNDTFVYHDGPDTNYGDRTTMQVRNDGGTASPKGKDMLSFFSFDISTFSGSVDSAQVDLNFLTSGDTVSDWDFELYGVPESNSDENFDEGTLTFNNSDSTIASGGAEEDGSLDRSKVTDVLASVDPTSYGEITFSSSDLNTFLNEDTNNRATFVITTNWATGSAAAEFATKEHDTEPAPTLTVVPEPSTLVLLGLGGLLLMKRRRV